MTSEKKIKNCWDFFSCDEALKKRCPAFRTDSGSECWFIASTLPTENKKKFGNCFNCPWYKNNKDYCASSA